MHVGIKECLKLVAGGPITATRCGMGIHFNKQNARKQRVGSNKNSEFNAAVYNSTEIKIITCFFRCG